MADLSCQQLVELVTAYLDGALDDDTARAFEDHLAVCPGCETYVEQFRVTIARLGEVSLETISPDTQARLLEVFRDLPR
jgi:anti-sigma factor RsiW